MQFAGRAVASIAKQQRCGSRSRMLLIRIYPSWTHRSRCGEHETHPVCTRAVVLEYHPRGSYFEKTFLSAQHSEVLKVRAAEENSGGVRAASHADGSARAGEKVAGCGTLLHFEVQPCLQNGLAYSGKSGRAETLLLFHLKVLQVDGEFTILHGVVELKGVAHL